MFCVKISKLLSYKWLTMSSFHEQYDQICCLNLYQWGCIFSIRFCHSNMTDFVSDCFTRYAFKTIGKQGIWLQEKLNWKLDNCHGLKLVLQITFFDSNFWNFKTLKNIVKILLFEPLLLLTQLELINFKPWQIWVMQKNYFSIFCMICNNFTSKTMKFLHSFQLRQANKNYFYFYFHTCIQRQRVVFDLGEMQLVP